MANNHISLRKIPLRLKVALLALFLHAGVYGWLLIETARSGDKVSPYWIVYLLVCLFVFPEVRNARVAAYVTVLLFCFVVPSCMLLVDYNSKSYEQLTFIASVIVFAPVYVAGAFVASAWSFYRNATVEGPPRAT